MTKINAVINNKDLSTKEREFLSYGLYPVGTCSCCGEKLYSWYSTKCDQCRTEGK